jgi:hypothetical protein
VTALLVSDQEREYTVELLRRHLLSGRLTTEEFEERVDEAWRARFASELWQALRALPPEPSPVVPPALRPAKNGTAVASLVIAIASLCMLTVSFGLLFALTLPLSATAWGLGRSARRAGGATASGTAVTGEVLGIVGTLLSLLLFAGCAALLAGAT